MKNLLLLVAAASLALAQAPPKDRAGCKDSTVLSRLPGCWIVNCKNMDYNGAEFPISKNEPRSKHLEGAFEQVWYVCPKTMSGMQVWREAQDAFKRAGFTQVFENNYMNSRFYLTEQKGAQWAHLYSDNGGYNVAAVKVKDISHGLQANAEGWAEQMNQSGRVSVYGINFDTGKATLRPDSEPVLKEVLALLQKQPDWYLLVAGHTDNVGTDAVNVPLSRQRAETVIAWLAAKGVNKARLTPAGFGALKPLEDNGTEDGRAKNRRVDLIKLY